LSRHSPESPIHPSLVRPILLGGAERELVLVNLLVIVVLLLGVGPHPITFLLAALLGSAGHSLLVLAARFDPQMWKVYARHLLYQPFYPALASFDAPLASVHPFLKQPR
jgi:type IV secretion system protein VirB3